MSHAQFPEGHAIVYCEGAFGTTNGKTAHGLVRRSERYGVLSVVDSTRAGADAGDVLDGRAAGIPVLDTIGSAVRAAHASGVRPTHFVVGLAPDGGRLPESARSDIGEAITMGLNVDCGLHDFLTEDPTFVELATTYNVTLRDIRKPPPRDTLHCFDGKIEEVTSLKVALLGTDSAVGKRTTAWLLVDALKTAGITAEMVGTGQTAWLQGARHGIILDSLINDFVAGEIEHAVWSAWHGGRPDVIVIEGQGSLMNPAYPGGFEILAAGRPDVVVLQHAPARVDYDGFPGHRLHPLAQQIEAIELISGKPVVAVTINHEEIPDDEIAQAVKRVGDEVDLPTYDVLKDGASDLATFIAGRLDGNRQ